MKIEDPLSPPGDQPDLNKLRRTKQSLPVLGSKPVLCRVCSQVCSCLEEGRGSGQRSLLSTPVPADSGPTESQHISAPLLVLPAGRARVGAWAGGQRAAAGGLQGPGLQLLAGWAGVPCPQLLAVFLFLAALLLRTLKVDTVKHLVREGNTRE